MLEKTAGQSVRIIADDRERAGPVIAVLQGLDGVTVQVQRLKTGDYAVDDWLFERKALPDFVESIKDGRIFSQAKRLQAAGQPAALILEGKAGAVAQSGMRREAIQGALISLSLIFQIPVFRSLDAVETAHLLCYAGDQLRRERIGWIGRRGGRPKRRRRQQLYLLQGLPGIGPQKAERLLEQFGNVGAVFSAEENELLQVAGIGEKIAQDIRSLLV